MDLRFLPCRLKSDISQVSESAHFRSYAMQQICTFLAAEFASAADKPTTTACRPSSEPRQAQPWYRSPISTWGPTVLVINDSRRLVRAWRDRDRAGSSGKRPPNPEAEISVPETSGAPLR